MLYISFMVCGYGVPENCVKGTRNLLTNPYKWPKWVRELRLFLATIRVAVFYSIDICF